MTVPATDVLDPINETFLIERNGNWVYGERTVRTTVLATGQGAVDIYGDPDWMDSVAAIPNLGSPWADSGRYFDLLLEEREPRIYNVDGISQRVNVRLIYRFQRSSAGAAQFPARGGATLQQIRTTTDVNDKVIEVSFKNDDDETETNTGEADVLAPSATTVRTAIFAERVPESLVNIKIGKVNPSTFAGGKAGEWLCFSIQFEPFQEVSSPPLWSFTFEFVRATDPENPHKYFVPFRRRGSNQIPAGVTKQNGITIVDYHEKVDFARLFTNL